MLDIPEGGWTHCKSKRCGKSIVFATSYTTGKQMPFELDDAGEWVISNGIAKHEGPPANQLELGTPKPAQRWTSHHARCIDAPQFRKK